MKNVVLIGDSIRLGYENEVRELLGDEVQIFSPKENCRYTKYQYSTRHGYFHLCVHTVLSSRKYCGNSNFSQ